MEIRRHGVKYSEFREATSNDPSFQAYLKSLDRLVCAPFDEELIKQFTQRHKDEFDPAICARIQVAPSGTLKLMYDKMRDQRRRDYEKDGKLEEFIRLSEELGTK